MTRIRANDASYFVTESGSGQPLLLLHGFTGSANNWAELTARLPKDWRVIAVDLPGHGRTEVPAEPERMGMEAVTDDLIAVLTELHALPASVLGYSMGGRLALYLAATYPEHVRRLILESASPGLATKRERDERRWQDEQLALDIETLGIEAFIDRWEKIPLFASQQRLPGSTRQAVRDQRLTNSPEGLAASLRDMGAGAQPSVWPILADIDLGILLVTGAMDSKFCEINRQMASRLPKAEHVIVDGAGHTVHLEQPEAFASLVASFLAR